MKYVIFLIAVITLQGCKALMPDTRCPVNRAIVLSVVDNEVLLDIKNEVFTVPSNSKTYKIGQKLWVVGFPNDKLRTNSYCKSDVRLLNRTNG